jgi:hypothetical protein
MTFARKWAPAAAIALAGAAVNVAANWWAEPFGPWPW